MQVGTIPLPLHRDEADLHGSSSHDVLHRNRLPGGRIRREVLSVDAVHPGVVIDFYTRGETLIEAYWKSVKWPGQGLFVGEPLAAPFSKKPVNHVELR